MRNILAPALHPDPANRLNSATPVESLLRKASRRWRKVSDLFSFTPRYVGTGQVNDEVQCGWLNDEVQLSSEHRFSLLVLQHPYQLLNLAFQCQKLEFLCLTY